MARLTSQQDGYGHALEDHYLGTHLFGRPLEPLAY
jgi:hypothetical protein